MIDLEKPIDLSIIDLKEKLLDNINDAKLPVTIIEMIVKELLGVIQNTALKEIQKQKMEYENSQQ